MALVRRLWDSDREAVRRHFIGDEEGCGGLDKEAVRLRFCTGLSREMVSARVDRMDFSKATILGVEDPSTGEIVGLAEIFPHPTRPEAEMAFSVSPGMRGKGLGSSLMDSAILHARNAGCQEATIICLAENSDMRRLAARGGMTLKMSEPGEMEGSRELPPADLGSVTAELTSELSATAARTFSLAARTAGQAFSGMLGFSSLVAREAGRLRAAASPARRLGM